MADDDNNSNNNNIPLFLSLTDYLLQAVSTFCPTGVLFISCPTSPRAQLPIHGREKRFI